MLQQVLVGQVAQPVLQAEHCLQLSLTGHIAPTAAAGAVVTQQAADARCCCPTTWGAMQL
jgi:hypothetical protein